MAFQAYISNFLLLRRQAKGPRLPKRRQRFFEQLESRCFLSATGLDGLSATPAVAVFRGPYEPYQIVQAYSLTGYKFAAGAATGTTGDGSGQTIALIDAYDDPSAYSDLQTFDATFKLPDPPNFVQVGETGGAPPTATNSGWAMETSLDIEWAHAVAPQANIMLVEANTASLTDLFAAVDYARNGWVGTSPVTVVSMSWGSSEFNTEASYDSHFTTPTEPPGTTAHPGVSFVAATGDNGAVPEYPSVSPNVLAVGGTSLTTKAGATLGKAKRDGAAAAAA